MKIGKIRHTRENLISVGLFTGTHENPPQGLQRSTEGLQGFPKGIKTGTHSHSLALTFTHSYSHTHSLLLTFARGADQGSRAGFEMTFRGKGIH